MGSSSKTPKAPNPSVTAGAQAGVNAATGITDQALDLINQVGPYGSLTYNQTGMRTIPAVYDANGKMITPARQVPAYTATTALTPEQQALLNQQTAFDTQMNQFGMDQLGRLQGVLDKPLDLSSTAVEDYVSALARKRLDPIWNQRRESMETQLRNQGLQPGTEAYDKAMLSFDQGMNDSYNQMLLDARGQGINEMLLSRQQPLNEITALMGAGQMQLPQWINTPNTNVNGVDYAGLVANNYNQKMAANNAFWGGLAGLGGAALQGAGMWGSGGWKLPW